MDISGTLLTGATFGVLIAAWGRIKTLAWRLASLFVVRFQVEGYAEIAMRAYLWKHAVKSRYGERRYLGYFRFVRPVDKEILVGQEEVGRDLATFWFGWRPLLAQFRDTTAGNTYMGTPLVITFIRGVFDPEAIVIAAIDEYNKQRHESADRRFRVTRVAGSRGRHKSDNGSSPTTGGVVQDGRTLRWTSEEIGAPVLDDPLSSLAFPPEIALLSTEAERWLASEGWYKERRIPWKLGWMLYGQPGGGEEQFQPTDGDEVRPTCIRPGIKYLR